MGTPFFLPKRKLNLVFDKTVLEKNNVLENILAPPQVWPLTNSVLVIGVCKIEKKHVSGTPISEPTLTETNMSMPLSTVTLNA